MGRTLILDLDGVLITTPPWKADDLDIDNYSKFNSECVDNINLMLSHAAFEIWISSTRRTSKSLNEFNSIFQRRGIQQAITGLLPQYSNQWSRKQEIESFLQQTQPKQYLIIDDDKSLNDLEPSIKPNLVLTNYLTGFNEECLKRAIQILDY